jgi:hypothetical protein
MSREHRIVLVATLILTSGAGGCSFALVNGPPPNHRQLSFFGCTSSNTIPMVDLGISALSVVDAALSAAGSSSSGLSTGSNKGDLVTFAASAALFGASAAYGYKRTAECRDAEALLVKRTPPAPMLAPTPYLPPPVPLDPWVPHPDVIPVAPPPGPAPPVARPPPAGGKSAWDPESPAK